MGKKVMLRILLIGYVYGFGRSANFSKNRYGRFRESDIYRVLFEDVVGQRCSAGLVGGSSVVVDGGLIGGDAGRNRRVESVRRDPGRRGDN
jgi:hypothetical protein